MSNQIICASMIILPDTATALAVSQNIYNVQLYTPRKCLQFLSSTLHFTKLKMPREVGPSLNERQFFLQALKEEVRIDSRGFGDFRAIQLEFGDEYGVSDVRIGKTRYILQLSIT